MERHARTLLCQPMEAGVCYIASSIYEGERVDGVAIHVAIG